MAFNPFFLTFSISFEKIPKVSYGNSNEYPDVITAPEGETPK